MHERALSFGSVASAYERYRPGYPDQLVDDVLTYAARRVRTALEIGAGTGKATRVFAPRGIAVTATEPDAAMLAELRRHVPPSVTTAQLAFENLPLSETYDLVYAAAAMHWTDPCGRWPRVAALLNPNGVFASFGGPLRPEDARIGEVVRAARREEHLPDDEVPSPDGTPVDAAMQWPGTELALSDQFTDVRQTSIRRRVRLTASEYIGHLSTVSAYAQLPGDVQQRVLARIRAALPEHVVLDADLTVHLARLADIQ